MKKPLNLLSKLTHEMTAISRSMHNRPPFRYTGFHPPSNQPTNQLARLATPQPAGSQGKPTFYSYPISYHSRTKLQVTKKTSGNTIFSTGLRRSSDLKPSAPTKLTTTSSGMASDPSRELKKVPNKSFYLKFFVT